MANKNPNHQHLTGDDALTRVRALLKHFRSAMLTTHTADGIRSRPMGLLGQADEFSGSLWFFTDRRDHKVAEVRGGTETTLIFQCDEKSAFLQLDGGASISSDRAKMEELFTPLLRTWFPDGLDDPNLALIRFDADAGRFWDSPGGTLHLLGAFTKAVLTGRPAGGGRSGDITLP